MLEVLILVYVIGWVFVQIWTTAGFAAGVEDPSLEIFVKTFFWPIRLLKLSGKILYKEFTTW